MSKTQGVILQRLLQAVREQSWGTLFIELVVLTLGVFLGFQVDRWYEEYREQQLADGYVVRLIADVKQDIETIGGVDQSAELRLDAVDLLAESLSNPGVVDKDPNRFIFSLEQAVYRFQLQPSVATYNELVSTGHMNYLPPQTRQALYDYHALISNFDQFKPTIDGVQNESFKRFAGILTPDLFSLQITLPSEPTLRQYTVAEARTAAERFWANEAAVAWLGRLKQAQLTMLRQNQFTLKEAQDLLDHLQSLGAAGAP